jgi:flotillin
VKHIQDHLQKLGLTVYNANIKDMMDYDSNNKYFTYVRQRAIETANYDAQVSVAEARKHGEIGVQERQRDTAIALAALHMETKVIENERAQKVAWSESELEQQKVAAYQAAEMKRIELETTFQIFAATRNKEVEEKRQQREMAMLRATEMTKTELQAEQKIRLAEAEARAKVVLAEAELEQDRKRAAGVLLMLEAHAQGLQAMSKDVPEDLAKFYLGLKDRLFQDVAKTQADAFRNMQPKFQIWSTGPKAESSDPSEVITRTLQNLAPVFSGLQQQAGSIKLPFLNPSVPKQPQPSCAAHEENSGPSS